MTTSSNTNSTSNEHDKTLDKTQGSMNERAQSVNEVKSTFKTTVN